MKYCGILGCKNLEGSFFNFPTDKAIADKWTVSITTKNNQSLTCRPKYFYVCHLHFNGSEFRPNTTKSNRPLLKKDAVPTIFSCEDDWGVEILNEDVKELANVSPTGEDEVTTIFSSEDDWGVEILNEDYKQLSNVFGEDEVTTIFSCDDDCVVEKSPENVSSSSFQNPRTNVSPIGKDEVTTIFSCDDDCDVEKSPANVSSTNVSPIGEDEVTTIFSCDDDCGVENSPENVLSLSFQNPSTSLSFQNPSTSISSQNRLKYLSDFKDDVDYSPKITKRRIMLYEKSLQKCKKRIRYLETKSYRLQKKVISFQELFEELKTSNPVKPLAFNTIKSRYNKDDLFNELCAKKRSTELANVSSLSSQNRLKYLSDFKDDLDYSPKTIKKRIMLYKNNLQKCKKRIKYLETKSYRLQKKVISFQELFEELEKSNLVTPLALNTIKGRFSKDDISNELCAKKRKSKIITELRSSAPSNVIKKICLSAEKTFRISDEKNMDKLIRLAFRQLDTSIFNSMNENFLNSDPLENHQSLFVKSVLQEYFKLRINHRNSQMVEEN